MSMECMVERPGPKISSKYLLSINNFDIKEAEQASDEASEEEKFVKKDSIIRSIKEEDFDEKESVF